MIKSAGLSTPTPGFWSQLLVSAWIGWINLFILLWTRNLRYHWIRTAIKTFSFRCITARFVRELFCRYFKKLFIACVTYLLINAISWKFSTTTTNGTSLALYVGAYTPSGNHVCVDRGWCVVFAKTQSLLTQISGFDSRKLGTPCFVPTWNSHILRDSIDAFKRRKYKALLSAREKELSSQGDIGKFLRSSDAI